MSNQIQDQEREQWGSKLGFILAAAGSAVGLGNIWKFPYITGQNGGGAFVLVYVFLVALIGFSVVLAEMVIGRRTQKNPVDSFRMLKGGAWPIVGWMGVAAGFIILSYYGVIGGWTIKYIISSFTGLMAEAGAGHAADAFTGFVSNVHAVVGFQCLFMLITIGVVYKGIGDGIEKYCKFLMPSLFLIIIVLIFRSCTLDGAEKGLEFYLKPDFSKVNGDVILAALGQAFFSLSIGMGVHITYGSYLSQDINIPSSGAQVCFLDTLVAFLSGLVIFPAAFAFGVEPGAGPGLTFITLPSVFAQMPGGMIWSAMFFLLLFVAALTSSISLLEVVTTYMVDKGWSRAKAAWVVGIVITVIGIPSAVSLGGGLKIAGKDFLDVADFMASNILLPLGGLLIAIFVGWVGTDMARKEITNSGTHAFALEGLWIFILRFIAPLAIAYIFFSGLKW